MATPQTPRPARSPLARYAPVLAVVVIVAIVIAIIAVVNGGKDDKNSVSTNTSTTTGSKPTFADVPIFYNEAKAAGTLDKYKWSDDCDTTTGLVKIPILNPPPCVAVHEGDNGGATAPGVSATTIKIGYYLPKPDPIYDAILTAAGAYDPPEKTAQAYKDYIDIYAHQYDAVGPQDRAGRDPGHRPQHRRGRSQSRRRQGCRRGCVRGPRRPGPGPELPDRARPQAHHVHRGLHRRRTAVVRRGELAVRLADRVRTPEQTAALTTELVKKQLGDGKAIYAGDPELQKQPRRYALLSYDTPNGEYKESWDNFYNDLKAAGLPLANNGHVSYFLNPQSLAADGRTIANKLKATGATTIIFTGDPIFPAYLTKNMTEQGYFPEWVMAGTVLADTAVFARTFDQKQWQHAFGLQLTPARLPKQKQDAYTLHEWWFGTPAPDAEQLRDHQG